MARTCTWCGDKGIEAYCPRCTARLTANTPDPATMTPTERADELASFRILEVPLSLMHGRIEALARRAVFTHELARYESIVLQVREERDLTPEEWIGALDPSKTILVVTP